MQTKIVKFKGDWEEVADDCRFTVGKEPLGHEPSDDFKRKMVIAEHSPIRSISVKWRWFRMPHWVTVHWVRHKWEKMVATQRVDRTGSKIPRNEHLQGEPQNFQGEANTQHLIDTWRKRLCFMASTETRHYAEDFKVTIHEPQPEISDALVPNCVYRGGCPELLQDPNHRCLFYEHLIAVEPDAASPDIQKRYDAYNRYFWEYLGRHVLKESENETV